MGWPSEWITLENPLLGPVGLPCGQMHTLVTDRVRQRNQSSHTIVVLAAIKKAAITCKWWLLVQKRKEETLGRCARWGREMQLKLTPTPIGPSRYMRRPTRNSPASFLRCIGEKQGRCMRVDSVAAITASSPDPVCPLCLCLLVSSRQID